MSNVLRTLVLAMSTTPVARHFVAECSEELATIPEVAAPVALILKLSTPKVNSRGETVIPVVGTAEKSAGITLFGIIRDKWSESLKATAPLPKAAPEVPRLAEGLTIKRIAPMGENGKLVGEGERPVTKLRGRAPSQGASKAAPNPNGSAPEDRAERVRQVINLPIVKVTAIPMLQRAAARHAFFADARRVEYRQSGIIADPDPITYRLTGEVSKDVTTQRDVEVSTRFGAIVVRKGPKGDDLKAADFPNMGAAKKVGIDPRVVLERHRDIIGTNPEGLRVLTCYEHHAVGPYAALDMVRRILHAEHIGLPKVTFIQEWIRHDPPGKPTAELRQARWAAEQLAHGAVMTKDANGKPCWHAYAESQPPTLYPAVDPKPRKSRDEAAE